MPLLASRISCYSLVITLAMRMPSGYLWPIGPPPAMNGHK